MIIKIQQGDNGFTIYDNVSDLRYKPIKDHPKLVRYCKITERYEFSICASCMEGEDCTDEQFNLNNSSHLMDYILHETGHYYETDNFVIIPTNRDALVLTLVSFSHNGDNFSVLTSDSIYLLNDNGKTIEKI